MSYIYIYLYVLIYNTININQLELYYTLYYAILYTYYILSS